jgi:hypothetical protein
MQERTPARIYALVVGAVLVVAGIIGFFYEPTFSGDPEVREAVFGILDVNAWHNLVHILTGAVGLAAFAAGAYASRLYALGFGAIYVVVAIWGFVVGDGGMILGFIPVNTEDNVLHVVIGVVGIAVGAASPSATTPSATRPA